MQRIANLCPDLKRIRILTEDRHLEIFAREASGLKIEELDAHIAWSRESGINPIKSFFFFFCNLITDPLIFCYLTVILRGIINVVQPIKLFI